MTFHASRSKTMQAESSKTTKQQTSWCEEGVGYAILIRFINRINIDRLTLEVSHWTASGNRNLIRKALPRGKRMRPCSCRLLPSFHPMHTTRNGKAAQLGVWERKSGGKIYSWHQTFYCWLNTRGVLNKLGIEQRHLETKYWETTTRDKKKQQVSQFVPPFWITCPGPSVTQLQRIESSSPSSGLC